MHEVDPRHLHRSRPIGEDRQAAAGCVAPDIHQDVEPIAADERRGVLVREFADGPHCAADWQFRLAVGIGAVEEDVDRFEVMRLEDGQDELRHLITREARTDVADAQPPVGGAARRGRGRGRQRRGIEFAPTTGFLRDAPQAVGRMEQGVEQELVDRGVVERVRRCAEDGDGLLHAALVLQGQAVGDERLAIQALKVQAAAQRDARAGHQLGGIELPAEA